MNDSHVPKHIRRLGKEATRLREIIEAALRDDGAADEPVTVPIAEAASVIMRLTVSHMQALVRLFNSPVAKRAGSSHGKAKHAYRLAGRLEESIDRLLDTWRLARAIALAPGDSAHVHDLLVEGVRDVLEQLAQVLDDLAIAIDTMDNHDSADGQTVTATLHVTLQAPAAFGELADWLGSQAASASLQSTGVAFVLGALFDHALFNGACDGAARRAQRR